MTREALAALEALLPDFEAAYSPTGRDTLSLRYEICRLLAVTGQRDRAWPRTAELLIDTRKLYGNGHPETEAVGQLLAKLEQLRR